MSSERQRNNRLQGRFAAPQRKSTTPLPRLSSEGNPGNQPPSAISLVYNKTDCYKPEDYVKETKVINDNPANKRVWLKLGETENGVSEIYFDPDFLSKEKADALLEKLSSAYIPWESKEITIKGETHPQPRLVHWIGPYEYKYSSVILHANNVWPDEVKDLQNEIEKSQLDKGAQGNLNSVLLNLYRNERDSVAWHSDDELSMGVRPFIASVSLGETRRFELKKKMSPNMPAMGAHSAVPEYQVHLSHGSLLIMGGALQDDWLHRVPKEYNKRGERINLTFRTVYPL